MEQPLLSWSQISQFNGCQRSWELKYVAGLERKPTKEKAALYRGSAFHAAVAEWLTSGDINKAWESAKAVLSELHIPNKLVKDYDNGGMKEDSEYYQMLEDVRSEVSDCVEYYLPRLNVGEGKRYRVARVCEVLGCTEITCEECSGTGLVDVGDEEDYCEDCDGNGSYCPRCDELMVEYEFIHMGVRGFIDAVLYDTELDRFVIVDWKLRTSMPYTHLVELDGQLHLYAAMLNLMGADITSAIMWQFKYAIPKPVKLNKNGSLSKQNSSTTIDRIMETLPYGWEQMTRDEILVFLDGKLKFDTDFEQPVEMVVTEFSEQMAKDNVNATIWNMTYARTRLEKGKQLPATISSFGCRFCDYNRLCATAFTHGVNPEEIIEEYYQPVEQRPLRIRE